MKFQVDEKKTYYICGCKYTANEPFCDGTHRKEETIKKYNKQLLQVKEKKCLKKMKMKNVKKIEKKYLKKFFLPLYK